MPLRLARWPLKLLGAAVAAVVLLLLPGAAWGFRPGAGLSPPRSSSSSSSSSSAPQSRASIIRRARGDAAQQQQQQQQQQQLQGPLTRRSMLTVGHDAAVQTALPLLFGRWTLKVRKRASLSHHEPPNVRVRLGAGDASH